MKKAASLLIAVLLSTALCAACSPRSATPAAPSAAASATAAPGASAAKPEVKTAVRVFALKGPTAMGMVRLMDDASKGPVNGVAYKISVLAAPDEVTGKLIKGDVDIASIPANLAAVLCNKTHGAVRVLAVNTLGVLYLAENTENGEAVHSIADLRGKTIYAAGKGATPEYALDYLLKQNGLTPGKDVTIEWKSEHTECVAALNARPGAIALLPQPFATVARMKNKAIHIALDLNELWKQAEKQQGHDNALITGVVVARREFIEQHPEEVHKFLASYQSSIEFVNDHVDEAAKLIGQADIVPEPVARQAIPYCHITFMAGEPMKQALGSYLQILAAQNPSAVGGRVPQADFYYDYPGAAGTRNAGAASATTAPVGH